MSSSAALSLPGVRVLLVGTSSHVSGSPLSSVEAVRRSVDALGRVLVERCGVDAANLRTVHDPETPRQLGGAITEAATEAESVLLLYYAGHGLVGSTDGELYLATHTTDDLVEGLSYKALPYAAVREVLTRCRARSIVVVLDCCFSGRAGGAYGTAASDAFAASAVRGTHVLAAAAHNEAALARPGDEHTAFTGRLLRLLVDGDPTRSEWLTLFDAYDYLDRALQADGFPRPRQHVSDTSGRLLLARNPAAPETPQFSDLPVATPVDGTCPYRGMDRYDAQDARYFFGRDNAVGELIDRLAGRIGEGPFIVVGPSGSGKSSLLRAGLLPAIESGALPGSSGWTTRVLTPGEHPMANPNAQPRPGTVLIVDQFEEVFTACQDKQEQLEFIRRLCAAEDGESLVIIGLRADFYARCMAHPELVSALRANTGLVAPMTNAELQEVIEKPARAAGLDLEPGLTGLVLRDLRAGHTEFDAAGALPLLSYALLATWQRRQGTTLTLAGYQASGGIWESVSRQAEATYAALSPDVQETARRTLLRMVRIGTGADHTRRRAPLAELAARTEPEASAVRQVLDVFAADRLITVDADTATITHESLLRAWPRLAQWIERDGADLVVHQQITDAAQHWAELDRDPGALYRGRALTEAELWRETRGNEFELTAVEREFLDASSADRRAQAEDADRQRARERRQNRRLRMLTAGLAVFLVIAAVTSVVAVLKQRTADEQQRIATARLLVSQAEAARAADPRLALQLGVAAEKIHSDSQTRGSLVGTLAATRYRGTLAGGGDSVNAVAFSPDSRTLATASTKYGRYAVVITLWDMSAKPPRRFESPLDFDNTTVDVVAFSPTDHILLAPPGDPNTTLSLWDVSDPARPVRRGSLDTGDRASVQSVAYAPDGRTIAVTQTSSVSLWDVSDPAQPRRLGTPLAEQGKFDSAAFSQDGRLVAAGGDDEVLVWDVADLARPRQVGPPLVGRGPVAFAPGGRLLATHLKDPQSKNQAAFVLWDLTQPSGPTRVGSPLSGNNSAIAFSPDGKTAATSGYEGVAVLWDISDPARPTRSGDPLSGHTDFVLAVAFAPDGHTLVTGSQDKTAILWDPTVLAQPVRLGTPVTSAEAIAFRPDGHLVASGSANGSTSLWELSDPGRPAERRDVAPGTSTELSPDGRTLAVRADNGEITLWDVSDATRPIRRGPPLTGGGYPALFSPDGRMLITGDEHKSVLWDLSDPERPVQRVQDLPAAIVLVAAFTADNRTLAVSNIYDFDGKITLWDVTDPAHPATQDAPVLAGDATNVTAVAFSPDSRLLATGRSDGTILLWDVTNRAAPGRLGQPLTGPHDPNGNTSSLNSTVTVLGMAFSGNGRTLATTNRANTLILWDTTDPAAAHDLGPPVALSEGFVLQTRFSPDGTSFATVSVDGPATLWDLTRVVDLQDHAAELACGITGTGLDEATWSRYVSGLPHQRTC